MQAQIPVVQLLGQKAAVTKLPALSRDPTSSQQGQTVSEGVSPFQSLLQELIEGEIHVS